MSMTSPSDRIEVITSFQSQQPISRVLDNPPTMFGDLGIDKSAQMILEADVGPLLQASEAAEDREAERGDAAPPCTRGANARHAGPADIADRS